MYFCIYTIYVKKFLDGLLKQLLFCCFIKHYRYFIMMIKSLVKESTIQKKLLQQENMLHEIYLVIKFFKYENRLIKYEL